MTSLFEQNGGTFTLAGDYYLPCLTVPNKANYNIGVWGLRRLNYLKKHRRILYVNLLTSGKLCNHLCAIDIAASEKYYAIIQQLIERQGVSETLKEENQILWVSKMNNIYACSTEIVCSELIYS